MHSLKLSNSTLSESVPLLGWALGMACVLTLILFGVMMGSAYVVEELLNPPIVEYTAS